MEKKQFITISLPIQIKIYLNLMHYSNDSNMSFKAKMGNKKVKML